MVGGDHIDGAVQDALNESFSVGGGAEGGIHLEAAVLLQISVIQHQVVGAGLAGHVKPLGLGVADQLHALLGGDVADVVGAPDLADELQVSADLGVLALGADASVAVGFGVLTVVDVAAAKEVVDLAVGDDHFAQGLGLHHGRAHHIVTLHAPPVVGEGDALARHALHVGQLLPRLAYGDGGVGVDVDDGVLFDDGGLFSQMLYRIGDGVQVGHGTHSGVAACRRRARARGDGLLIRKARLTKMHMHIAKTGQNNNIPAVELSEIHSSATAKNRAVKNRRTSRRNSRQMGNIRFLHSQYVLHFDSFSAIQLFVLLYHNGGKSSSGKV